MFIFKRKDIDRPFCRDAIPTDWRVSCHIGDIKWNILPAGLAKSLEYFVDFCMLLSHGRAGDASVTTSTKQAARPSQVFL
ncbi:MAG: hypothetical protein HQM02_10300 [Magnetococcales bacterium]|nr:hypothetical protein [Magnetococcales bacterium]